MEINQLLIKSGSRQRVMDLAVRYAGSFVTGLLLCALTCRSLAADSEAQVHSEAQILLQTSRLAGFRYYDGKQVWHQMHEGDPLDLIREPDNSYDSRAIRVDWHGYPLGYVPRTDNAALARLLDHGVKLQARIVRLMVSRNVWQRVLFEVYEPLSQ